MPVGNAIGDVTIHSSNHAMVITTVGFGHKKLIICFWFPSWMNGAINVQCTKYMSMKMAMVP